MVFESDLPAPAKLTCAALRTFMNDHTEMAWPAVARLAAMTSQSERTVQRHLQLLCERKFLLKNGFSSVGTNRYLISLEGVSQSHPRHSDTPSQSRGGVSQSQDGGVTESPELNKRNNNNQGRDRKALNLDEVPESWREDIREYIAHRKAIKKPLTQQALTRFVNKVHKCVEAGFSASDAIHTPIDRGWSDISPEWLRNAKSKQATVNEHYF